MYNYNLYSVNKIQRANVINIFIIDNVFNKNFSITVWFM